jgi:hypothetical protein
MVPIFTLHLKFKKSTVNRLIMFFTSKNWNLLIHKAKSSNDILGQSSGFYMYQIKKKLGCKMKWALCLWLIPVILSTQEGEIRRIVIWSQPKQIVHEILSGKYPSQKRAGGVTNSKGPEFKPQYHKKKKKEMENTIVILLSWIFRL